MKDHSHHLLRDGTFPVDWLPGSEGPPLVGIRELLLRSHEIAGLAITEPPAHSATLRILYAVTSAVCGLDEVGPARDWEERREEILDRGRLPPGGIEAYEEKYGDRFRVFDPEGGRPWMQDPRLGVQCDPRNTAGVDKLLVTRPSGNNHRWFRSSTTGIAEFPAIPEAVLGLLTWHYYGPSGRCSAREVNGSKSASSTAGPLRTALSYHPEGDTLFETLLAGVPKPPSGLRAADDLCPWERDHLPDPDKEPEPPRGPRSRLTGCSQHALLLVPDPENPGRVSDAFITWAYRNGRIPRDDPFLIWQISQAGNRYPRPASSARALWRDLDALLLHGAVGTAQAVRPEIFGTALDASEDLRIRALGFEQEAQAKDIQFVDSSTPPLLGFAEQQAAHTAAEVARLRDLGELYGRRLIRAVKHAWAGFVNDPKNSGDTWAEDAQARYWPAAESIFWRRFRALDLTPGPEGTLMDAAAARKEFLTAAIEAFEHVTAAAYRTDRGARAAATARVQLFRGSTHPAPSPSTSDE
jgi:CRISPR system Cascade subunit CasA